MRKLANILEQAKEDRFVKRSGRFSIYRFKGEGKLRIDSGDMWKAFNNSPFESITAVVLITMEFKADRWEILNISDEARRMIFKEALAEGNKLYYGGFMPELDNLSSDTLGSVLFKVLHEWDLLDEGEDCMSDINPRTAKAWVKKAEAYFRKYRDYLEGEESSEYNMYKQF